MLSFNSLLISNQRKNLLLVLYYLHLIISSKYREYRMIVVKFRISLYALITSMVSCFRKCHSKVLMRFCHFEIWAGKFKNCHNLAASRRREWLKFVHFPFARDQRDDVYQCTLGSSCLAVSKGLI